MDLAQARAELGMDLTANCYVSEAMGEIIVQPPGLRLPLDSDVESIGQAMVEALLATKAKPTGALVATSDTTYLHVTLRADEHWLHLEVPEYANMDDAWLQLDAAVRHGSPAAELGNWLLRLHGAWRALEHTQSEWWRPLPGEFTGIG